MHRVVRSKFLIPSAATFLPRPRLLEAIGEPHVLVLQAPVGAGKSAVLAQWLAGEKRPRLYYRLDQTDRDGAVFAAHVAAGLRQVWPDWQPPDTEDPQELAAELAGEAAVRPPAILALDGLEVAFGEAWLADALAILLTYASPTLTLALATRAPPPVDVSAARVLKAADLAFTREEAEAWLGAAGDWQQCFQTTGGLPLALEVWRQQGANWPADLTTRIMAAQPPYHFPEGYRGLVSEWLSGNLPLEAFAHQVSVGQPGAEQYWREIGELHFLMCDDPVAAKARLDPLWEQARGRGDRPLVGAVAMLEGEVAFTFGEHAQAMEWYRMAFEADPKLELVGSHSLVILLRDLGRMEEAEALGRRCLEARRGWGDLSALCMAHLQLGQILTELGQMEKAEECLLEAQRISQKLAGNPAITLSAVCYKAIMELNRGNAANFRKYAEEAYGLAQGRYRCLQAYCGQVLADALSMWGEREAAQRVLVESFDYLSSIGAKWHMHGMLTLFAKTAWAAGRLDEARQHFDQALALAASGGYLHHLATPRVNAAPLLADALARGVEVPFCQELLVRMGAAAVPTLLELAARPDPQARRAVLYPLAHIGGAEAVEAIRRLLHDEEHAVRDSALWAYSSLKREAAEAPGAPAVGAAPLVVEILGPLNVRVEGRPVARWKTAKARDLLAYFLLLGGRPATRDQVVEALWPETDPDNARTLLHTSLYNLRGTLGAVAEGVISFAGGAYRMDTAKLDTDYDRFRRLVAAEEADSWRAAANLYRGDLLDGLDYPWIEGPRTQARRLYQSTLRKLAEHAGTAESIEFLQLLIQVDPLDEEAHRSLMEAYAAQGNRSAALQQYRALAKLLDEELGLEPGAAIQALHRKLID